MSATSACRTSCASTRCSPTASAGSSSGRAATSPGCASRAGTPTPSSPRLIGGGGTYAVTPTDRFVWGGYYEHGSLIWRSRWITDDAIVECREALALPGRAGPGGDPAAHRRRARARRACDVALDPRGALRPPRAGASCQRATTASGRAESATCGMRWVGAADGRARGRRRRRQAARRSTSSSTEGAHHDLVLVLDQRGADASRRRTPTGAWSATEAAWRERVPELRCATVAARDAGHAYAVLSGLTSAGGGMVAAATTSLPERARAGPQLRLPLRLDPRPVLRRPGGRRRRAATRCSTTRCASSPSACSPTGPTLEPAYTTTGEPVPDERRLEPARLPGRHRHRRQLGQPAVPARRLRRGAAAASPRPPATTTSTPTAGAPPRPRSTRSKRAGASPTPGIWELDPDRWTHSRLICAAGLRADRRAARRATRARRPLARPRRHDRRRHRRRTPLHPSGRWQRSPTDARVDAALLLPAIRGALPADDPRSLATLRGGRARADRGRLLLPLPPRRAPARRGRGRLPALRLLARARLRPAGRPRRRRALVRAQPRRLRPAGPARPRSSTSPSASCAATCRRRSSTRCCSSARSPSPRELFADRLLPLAVVGGVSSAV